MVSLLSIKCLAQFHFEKPGWHKWQSSKQGTFRRTHFGVPRAPKYRSRSLARHLTANRWSLYVEKETKMQAYNDMLNPSNSTEFKNYVIPLSFIPLHFKTFKGYFKRYQSNWMKKLRRYQIMLPKSNIENYSSLWKEDFGCGNKKTKMVNRGAKSVRPTWVLCKICFKAQYWSFLQIGQCIIEILSAILKDCILCNIVCLASLQV